MKKRFSGLVDLVGTDTLVSIDRKLVDQDSLDGFVVGVSEKLLCLHVVNGQSLALDGYSIMRLADIRSCRTIEMSFIGRALRLVGIAPNMIESLDLSNWRSSLKSLYSLYPLVSIYTEQKAPDSLFIGQQLKRSAKSLVIKDVDTSGHWNGREKFAYKDITMIIVGDGYANVLAALMAYEGTLSPIRASSGTLANSVGSERDEGA